MREHTRETLLAVLALPVVMLLRHVGVLSGWPATLLLASSVVLAVAAAFHAIVNELATRRRV